jgi:hypothetical protein
LDSQENQSTSFLPGGVSTAAEEGSYKAAPAVEVKAEVASEVKIVSEPSDKVKNFAEG